MSNDLDRKIEPRDSAALQHRPIRVLKPSKRDVLLGRGAPIQSHEGNVRMRSIVSKYAQRYTKARKYRKQLIAEDALMAVKSSSFDKKPVRFLKKVDGEDCWEEVDDKTACDKVQHTLRNVLRKQDGEGGSRNSASEGSSSLTDASKTQRRASFDSLPQSNLLPTQETLDRSAVGIDALRRTYPMSMYLGQGSLPIANNTLSLPTSSGLYPGALPPQYSASSSGTSQISSEAELHYRLSLRRMSTEDLIRLVAAERAERSQRQALALENPTLRASISPVAQFRQQDFQRMPFSVTGLAAQTRETVSAEGGSNAFERGNKDGSDAKANRNMKEF